MTNEFANISASTTAAQNQVTAVNSIVRTLQYISGQFSSITYAGPTTVQIYSGPGRLVNVSIVISGGGTIEFYDTASITALPANSLMFAMAGNSPLGITQIGVQFSDGVALVLGSGVSANVTYSVG
jgi:hypothetical protein